MRSRPGHEGADPREWLALPRGQNRRLWREFWGFSTHALASRLGISQMSVRRLEKPQEKKVI